MKNNKALVIICVILLNVLVVFMVGQAFAGKESDYDKMLRQAREYTQQELYRKALGYYNEALDYEESLDIRIEMIPVYEKAVENGELQNINAILSDIEDIIELHPAEARAYEAICSFMEKYEQFETCAELLMQAADRKIVSDELTALLGRVRYNHKLSYTIYSEVSSEYNGSYLVQADDVYGVLDSSLNAYVGGAKYASSFSEGFAFVSKGQPDGEFLSYVIDKAGVRQCYLKDVAESSGVGRGTDADGNPVLLLAGKSGERYHYYNMNGQAVFGDYLFAGRFRNNVAAVKEGENSWRLINAAGQPIVDTVFEDVILNEFDECAPKGLIFAKTNGKYNLYSMNGARIGDFSCDDARPFIETVTAFKSGDKWGFVDAAGVVKIEPKYDDAKAFSKGIAGVKQNEFWSFIDSEGNVVIEGDYEEAGHLGSNGMCFVKINGRWAVLKMYYIAD